MGKYLSIILGIAAAVVGIVLLIDWWYEFLFVARACVPIALIIGGLVGLLAGISELKDALKHG